MAGEGRTLFPIASQRLPAQPTVGGLTSQARGAKQARAFSIFSFPATRPGMCRTCCLLTGRDTGALAAGWVHVGL
jgi:hypothetical protein